jgi:hypothetical protein
MTPQESKHLKIGDRVRWKDDAKDQGEIVGRDWSGVQIKWDSGKTTYYHHNDMRAVSRIPTRV